MSASYDHVFLVGLVMDVDGFNIEESEINASLTLFKSVSK